MRVLRFILEKEFKQLLRNSFLPKLLVMFPVMVLLVLPWAADMEVRDVSLVVVDNDHSPVSRRLVAKLDASEYFHLYRCVDTYDEALRLVESSSVDAILEMPLHLEKRWMVEHVPAPVLIAINAVNGSKGMLAGSYLQSIVNEYWRELLRELPEHIQVVGPSVGVTTRYLFNPYLNYRYYMVPALMVTMLTLLCGFLPALNVVGEKEAGTIEQINVTPVNRYVFILAKLIPYWLIGFLILTFALVLVRLVYGFAPAGSLVALYVLVLIFVFAMSGLGLVISNYSATMQQSLFVIWFCLIIFILMSGMFTPTESMPDWARYITVFNPLKYLVQVMRAVYLKGSTLGDLLPQAAALSAFALVFDAWAVWSYRKKS